jgi:type IV pilus assembly protein PilA
MSKYFKGSFFGFTIIELLITLAIIAIIAVVAVPSYINYTRRARYSEVVQASAPYKLGVTECYHTTGALTGCNAGSNGIPAARTAATGQIASVAVAAGVITITPVASNGFVATDTYVLTPTIDTNNNILTWAASGGGITKGYAR